MPDTKYDDFEVAAIVKEEGLDYAILHYMGSDYIENPVTAKLWDEAEKALNGLVEHLHLDRD